MGLCYTGISDYSLPFLLLSCFEEDVFISLLFNQQSMQLQIFGLLVCLANLFSVWFTTCGFSSSPKKCYYLKWSISNCSGFNCLDTQGSVFGYCYFLDMFRKKWVSVYRCLYKGQEFYCKFLLNSNGCQQVYDNIPGIIALLRRTSIPDRLYGTSL